MPILCSTRSSKDYKAKRCVGLGSSHKKPDGMLIRRATLELAALRQKIGVSYASMTIDLNRLKSHKASMS